MNVVVVLVRAGLRSELVSWTLDMLFSDLVEWETVYVSEQI